MPALSRMRRSGCQVRLEVPPALHRARVDLLAHLHGARRGAGGFVLVELEAGRFEIQAQLLQQPPGLAFLVADQRLVFHFDQPLAQQRAPMARQAVVRKVIVGHVLEGVGVTEERLLVHGKAGVHGMAPQVQQAGVRPGLGDETEVQDVLRPLLDEEGAGAEAVAHRVQVTVGHAGDVLLRRRRHHGRCHAFDARHAADLAQHPLHELRLADALHLRVAGEDALGQGGAGARQADDENRRLAGNFRRHRGRAAEASHAASQTSMMRSISATSVATS